MNVIEYSEIVTLDDYRQKAMLSNDLTFEIHYATLISSYSDEELEAIKSFCKHTYLNILDNLGYNQENPPDIELVDYTLISKNDYILIHNNKLHCSLVFPKGGFLQFNNIFSFNFIPPECDLEITENPVNNLSKLYYRSKK